MRVWTVILFFIFTVPGFLYADQISEEKGLSVTGVQFAVSPDVYQSESAFFGTVESQIKKTLVSDNKPDLIVFPEYIGVFYQLIGYNRILKQYSTFEAALTAILADNPELHSMADIFKQSGAIGSYLDGWSRLAAKYGVSLIAGSSFVAAGNGRLRNRTFVFNKDGKLIYRQDKVFLTDFEKTIVGLSAGSIDDADAFFINGYPLVLTLCRDTYAQEWEQKNTDAFLWIDIKANGEVFDAGQQRSFLRALPARMQNTDIPYGMTVCTVGHYLDLFWEGRSYILKKNEQGLRFIQVAGSSCDTALVSLQKE